MIPAPVKKTLLWRREPSGERALKAPNLEEDRSFCCWIAGQRLAQKECFFHRHRYHIVHAPNLPTKIIPTKIRWRKTSAKCRMDIRIPPLKFKTLLESNPPTSIILVRRLAICQVISLLRFCWVSVISVDCLLICCWICVESEHTKLNRNSTETQHLR